MKPKSSTFTPLVRPRHATPLPVGNNNLYITMSSILHIEKDRFRTALSWLLVIVVYYIWFQAFYNIVRFRDAFPYEGVVDMLTGVAYNFPPIFLVFCANLFIVFRLVKVKNLKVKIGIDFVVSILLSNFINLLYLAVLGIFSGGQIDWGGTTLNDIIILIAVEGVYYFKQLLLSSKKIDEAQRKALQYQYDALKSQVNPHFLFNSLSLLYSLVTIDPPKAKLFIRELSHMYRYILAKDGCESVSVDDEMEFLASYISVLEMRFDNKFRVEITGTPPQHACIIPFTMQLLVENVTKHNTITALSPMTVKINITSQEITITNPIFPRKANSISNIGLRYITQLYAAHHKTFSVTNDGEHFTAHVPYL